ncbi:protein FAR1-RELATED SEQUENCE 5-like [Magnolia sinica]|uniref:protein FAR1-RELATED SEQUENCE 5-like n=1 Tax=Magnolia sinica TaxID=86752 RepID=UPI0026583F77|nr:protein FAR1-RELATED SEQUENCE 5-like [Magnolia sinica]XP_058082042.1 protein FAR1-RELATED SEQUENCE 5-like [Magnolia sinica]
MEGVDKTHTLRWAPQPLTTLECWGHHPIRFRVSVTTQSASHELRGVGVTTQSTSRRWWQGHHAIFVLSRSHHLLLARDLTTSSSLSRQRQWSIDDMDDNTLERQAVSQSGRRLDFDIEMNDQEVRQEVDDEEAKEDVLVNTDEKLGEEPKIGMEFSSDDSAYEFYNRYAAKIGFSVRKSWVKKSDKGVLLKRKFCCSKEGQKCEDKRINQPKYYRPITRTQCLASMMIRLQKNGKYKVTNFVAEHNHEVVAPSKVHLLRSQRQSGGRKNMGFVPDDYKNYLRKKQMKAMEKGDARAVLEYFQKMQVENPSFFYAIQVDEDDQITNIFWADAKSVMDYNAFGDVVCFDTTYRINSYGRPFAPFIGVNHHKQTIIFGTALLYDETLESFKWLFQTFLSAMSGKKPLTILTDQDDVMTNAIAAVMPETNHRLCTWYIHQNATKCLSHVFNGSKSFEHDFSKCLYDYEDEEEFLTAWNNMLEKYDLMQNKWLQDLFKEREKWALAYERNTFYADMRSTQRSEGMNNVLKKFLNSKFNLLHFFTHYERLVANQRYQESIADFKMRQNTPLLFVDVKILKEAAKAYTPQAFEMFQNEFKEFLGHAIFKCGEFGTVTEFRVICDEKDEGRIVRFDSLDNTVTCSCKKFEFVGILCSHALKVLDHHNIEVLHPRYIMKRWQRDAKVGFSKDHAGFTIQGGSSVALGKRYSYLCRKLLKIAAMAGEHDEVFKFADRYADKFHDEVMECMKGIHEPPLMTTPATDEIIDTESARSEPKEKEVTFVDSVSSQTASGIKVKPRVGSSRRALKNSPDKVKKKRSRTESIHSQANQERQEAAQANQESQEVAQVNQEREEAAQVPNIIHPHSFQPSHYSVTIPTMSHFNQGSHIIIPSGSHTGHSHHMVMGYTLGPSGSINASLDHYGHQQPNVSINQENSVGIKSPIRSSYVTRASRFGVPGSGTGGSMSSPSEYPRVPSSNPQLSHLHQDSSKGSAAFSQSSSLLSDNNQSVGYEDHLRSSN